MTETSTNILKGHQLKSTSFCLDNVEVPAIKLPKGYKAQETNLLIQGICNNCQ